MALAPIANATPIRFYLRCTHTHKLTILPCKPASTPSSTRNALGTKGDAPSRNIPRPRSPAAPKEPWPVLTNPFLALRFFAGSLSTLNATSVYNVYTIFQNFQSSRKSVSL